MKRKRKNPEIVIKQQEKEYQNKITNRVFEEHYILNNIAKRDLDTVQSHFIYNKNLYALQNKIGEEKWEGIDLFTNETIKVKKNKCIFISKKEPILKLYYSFLKGLAYLKYNEKIKKISFNNELNEFYELNDKYATIFAQRYYQMTKDVILMSFLKQ
jgi:hypothetical protein